MLPDVPALAGCLDHHFERNGWFGLYAPAGTPVPVLDRLHAAAVGALADATVRRRLVEAGALAGQGDRASFAAFVRNQRSLTDRLAAEGILRPD